MAGLTVYQIYERSAYYCMDPITVVVTESNQDSGVMPAMVICPPGQFRASLAPKSAYGLSKKDGSGPVKSDLFNFEQHRDAFIANFRRTNISFTSADVDTLLQELKSIYENLKSVPEEELPKVLDRLDNMSTSWKDRFPSLASKLSTKEPVSKGMIPLKADSFTDPTDSNGYVKYRVLNGLYDTCTKQWLPSYTDKSSFPDWSRAIRDIMKCRINGVSGQPSGIIGDLIRFTTYSRLINLARPNLNDVVLDCKWFNGDFSASDQKCNVTSVWTPFGQCFRIAALEGANLSSSSPKSNTNVNVLIDTLKAEFPNALTKVFFYSQGETEFATTNGGIQIHPGFKSYLMIEQMRQNTRAAKNCGSTSLRHFKSYSKDKCIWEKSTEPVEKECNCLYDRAPNYLQDAGEEIAKMQADFAYISSLNFCSMPDTFFCAQNAIGKYLSYDYDCPDDCEELQPEVSLITYPLDPKTTYSRIPGDFYRMVTGYMRRLAEYDGFSNAPGSDQLNDLLFEQFLTQMKLISIFWWKNKAEYSEPFYMAWFQDTDKYSMNEINNYFGFFNSTSPSYSPLPFDFDETLFDQAGEEYSFFTKLVTSILEKYETSQKDWTYSYSKESMEPFYNSIIADLEAAKSATDQFAELRLLVLNKFVEEYTKFYKCVTSSQKTLSECYATYGCQKDRAYDNILRRYSFRCYQGSGLLQQYADRLETDKTATEYWVPVSICDLEQSLQFSNTENVATTGLPLIQELKHWIETLLQIKSDIDTDFSVWQAPWGIYTKWFRKELKLANSDSTKYIAEALSTFANTSDIFKIGNNYRDGSINRDNLIKVHLDLVNALNLLYWPLKKIMGCEQ
uniref:Uncharacterized protein n=1 Tax=Plectus sambesii TaxID=2011161 RepID=A0A914W958_9BILA